MDTHRQTAADSLLKLMLSSGESLCQEPKMSKKILERHTPHMHVVAAHQDMPQPVPLLCKHLRYMQAYTFFRFDWSVCCASDSCFVLLVMSAPGGGYARCVGARLRVDLGGSGGFVNAVCAATISPCSDNNRKLNGSTVFVTKESGCELLHVLRCSASHKAICQHVDIAQEATGQTNDLHEVHICM